MSVEEIARIQLQVCLHIRNTGDYTCIDTVTNILKQLITRNLQGGNEIKQNTFRVTNQRTCQCISYTNSPGSLLTLCLVLQCCYWRMNSDLHCLSDQLYSLAQTPCKNLRMFAEFPPCSPHYLGSLVILRLCFGKDQCWWLQSVLGSY